MADADSKDRTDNPVTDVSFQVYEVPRIAGMTPEQLRERIFQLWQAAEIGYTYICNFPPDRHGASAGAIERASKLVGDALYGKGPLGIEGIGELREVRKMREHGVEAVIYEFTNPYVPGSPEYKQYDSDEVSRHVTRHVTRHEDLEYPKYLEEQEGPEEAQDGSDK